MAIFDRCHEYQFLQKKLLTFSNPFFSKYYHRPLLDSLVPHYFMNLNRQYHGKKYWFMYKQGKKIMSMLQNNTVSHLKLSIV